RALRHDVFSAGFPAVLLPRLGQALKPTAKSKVGPLSTEPRGASIEVLTADGAVLGRGATSAQAWVRAQLLLARAINHPVAPPGTPPMFVKLSQRLFRPCTRRTLLVVVESADLVGTPHDPLNRGPERQIATRQAFVIALVPDGRPSAQVVPVRTAVERVMIA